MPGDVNAGDQEMRVHEIVIVIAGLFVGSNAAGSMARRDAHPAAARTVPAPAAVPARFAAGDANGVARGFAARDGGARHAAVARRFGPRKDAARAVAPGSPDSPSIAVR
jgi:hypothetical protein